jgi:hypothetical protein
VFVGVRFAGAPPRGTVRVESMSAAPRLLVVVVLVLVTGGLTLWAGTTLLSPTQTVPNPTSSPEPEPTSPPDPTPSPNLIVATLAPGATAEVRNTGQCLNVRLRPSLSGQAVDCLPDGTLLRVIGGPVEADGITWWEVSRQHLPTAGWVSGEYLQLVDP